MLTQCLLLTPLAGQSCCFSSKDLFLVIGQYLVAGLTFLWGFLSTWFFYFPLIVTWGCWSWSTHSTLTSSIWWNIDDLSHSAIIRFKLLLYDKYLQKQTSLQSSVTAWQLVLMTDIAALQCALSEVDLIQETTKTNEPPPRFHCCLWLR